MFAQMTNDELAKIIKAFYTCDNCNNCPCDGTVCVGENSYEIRKRFAIEVANRLQKQNL